MSEYGNHGGGCQAGREATCSEGSELEARPVAADEEAPELVNRRVALLVAAGSAMAAGCEPCLDQIIPNLIEAGVADEDIRQAVEIGNQVKDAAAEYIKEVADVLAGTRLAGSLPLDGSSPDPAKESAACCG